MEWHDVGEHSLYVADDGRVCGEVHQRIKEGFTMYHSIVNGKFIGKYIQMVAAKVAVQDNQHLASEQNQNLNANNDQGVQNA